MTHTSSHPIQLKRTPRMPYRTLIAIALGSALSVASTADEIPVTTSIQEIALFRDGAMVTRQGQTAVPAGKSVLRFEGLPSQVDTTALKADFLNQPNGLIRNAKIYVPERPEELESVKALQDALDQAKQEKELQQRERAQATDEITFAQAMRTSFGKEYGKVGEGGSLTLDQAKELASFVTDTQRQAYARVDAADQRIKAIDERIEEIEKDLQKAQETARLLSSIAEVEIEMAEASEVEIALSYLANAARWVPQYELRARPDEKALDFGYFASIWQHTGEAWTDVTLTLHTNQANRQGNVPILNPLELRKQEERYRRQTGEEIFELSSFSVDASEDKGYRAKESIAGAKAPSGLAAVTASTVSFQAAIPGKITVPSSRDSSAYEVLEATLEAEFWSEAVPRIQLDTYLRAKIRNTLDLPILPGQALAFVDGKLSSKVALDKILPEEETELSLGTDANIIVKRREGSQKDTDSGFIDKTTTLQRSYANEVVNYHGVAHKVIIVDQFPISQNAKIEIRRKAPVPSEVVIEDENNGIFKWEATLAPKEERTFTTTFDVIYPRDWDLYPEL